jgi:putative cell wall-binding protein
MKKKLPVLILALIILLQAFVPVVYAASENVAISSSVYLCPFDTTSEGAATKTGLNNSATLYQIEGSLNGVPIKP